MVACRDCPDTVAYGRKRCPFHLAIDSAHRTISRCRSQRPTNTALIARVRSDICKARRLHADGDAEGATECLLSSSSSSSSSASSSGAQPERATVAASASASASRSVSVSNTRTVLRRTITRTPLPDGGVQEREETESQQVTMTHTEHIHMEIKKVSKTYRENIRVEHRDRFQQLCDAGAWAKWRQDREGTLRSRWDISSGCCRFSELPLDECLERHVSNFKSAVASGTSYNALCELGYRGDVATPWKTSRDLRRRCRECALPWKCMHHSSPRGCLYSTIGSGHVHVSVASVEDQLSFADAFERGDLSAATAHVVMVQVILRVLLDIGAPPAAECHLTTGPCRLGTGDVLGVPQVCSEIRTLNVETSLDITPYVRVQVPLPLPIAIKLLATQAERLSSLGAWAERHSAHGIMDLQDDAGSMFGISLSVVDNDPAFSNVRDLIKYQS